MDGTQEMLKSKTKCAVQERHTWEIAKGEFVDFQNDIFRKRP